MVVENLSSNAMYVINKEQHKVLNEQIGLRHIADIEVFYPQCEWKEIKKAGEKAYKLIKKW